MEDDFFFNDTATAEIYTLSLLDALPIFPGRLHLQPVPRARRRAAAVPHRPPPPVPGRERRGRAPRALDRKSTRLNSSHANISYAVFCLKKKKLGVPMQLPIHLRSIITSF